MAAPDPRLFCQSRPELSGHPRINVIYPRLSCGVGPHRTGMVGVGDATPPADLWTPPIRNIDRWWSADRLRVLAWLNGRIGQLPSRPAKDLLLVAFCRLAIEWSNAAFNHQSMSFNDGRQPSLFDVGERTQILESYRTIAHQIIQDAVIELPVEPRVVAGDSRRINRLIQGPYSGVITSPPYPNRISYIRELRPYMRSEERR